MEDQYLTYSHHINIKRPGIALAIGLLWIMLVNCSSEPPVSDHPGAEVALSYCGSCHLVPAPQDLPHNIWEEEVLPKMGAFLGKYGSRSRRFYLENTQTAPYLESLYPIKATIDSLDWALLQDYYLTAAPPTPPLTPEPAPIRKLRQFSVNPVTLPDEKTDAPYTTLLKFDDLRKEIIVGAAGQRGGRLRTFDHKHTLIGEREVDSAPVDIDPATGTILTMGSLVPSDLPRGKVSSYSSDSLRILLDTLARPVAMERLDLDRDGTAELIVAEFGNMAGALNVYLPDEAGVYRLKRTLSGRSGAIRLRATDLDQDGWTDLVALFGQGDESVVAYFSRPGGVERKILLRFPPSYGSSDLEIADMNDDGHPDLICTNGDNFDYPPFPKNYHGIRIYENDGEGSFTEEMFFHLDGAYNVEVADFDSDGDMDLAAVAYFVPDHLRPTHSFVYLRRSWSLHGYNFKPAGFRKPDGVHYLTMVQGDVDQDGDVDLLLGNFAAYLPNGIVSDVKQGAPLPAYLFLKNTAITSGQ
ncbi:VCBS repeat-containing protein [Neolewinella aurantiaca]|uniref:VCBS repeat-containing protein n=1 Tax=Neolewinella aurantiaca TaxID=2602767 RepID=A0A5C7FLU8_9BACT|nr:VCBS repeat-containing protein [Neolewinella aurantiaca]TXF88342.1 VCBS repeat-containing protein [Neolewinella aurantiaca]